MEDLSLKMIEYECILTHTYMHACKHTYVHTYMSVVRSLVSWCSVLDWALQIRLFHFKMDIRLHPLESLFHSSPPVSNDSVLHCDVTILPHTTD